MSRKGHCYDNAVTESFFSTVKNDLVHDRDYHTHEEAWAERQRLHQTLGYVSPEQFETQNPVPLRGCLRNRGWLRLLFRVSRAKFHPRGVPGLRANIVGRSGDPPRLFWDRRLELTEAPRLKTVAE